MLKWAKEQFDEPFIFFLGGNFRTHDFRLGIFSDLLWKYAPRQARRLGGPTGQLSWASLTGQAASWAGHGQADWPAARQAGPGQPGQGEPVCPDGVEWGGIAAATGGACVPTGMGRRACQKDVKEPIGLQLVPCSVLDGAVGRGPW